MSWITDILDTLSDLPTPVVLLAAAAFSIAESGLGVGIVIPGETVVLVLGAAMDNPVALVSLFLIVGLANSAGDHIGYFLGRRYGHRLRDTYPGRRIGAANWDRALQALQRYGAWAVFLTRLLPIVRTLTPATAGMAKVPYPHFLPASLTGAYMWSALYVFAGALAGASVERIETVIGNTGTVILVVLVVLVLVVFALRRRRAGAVRSAAAPLVRRSTVSVGSDEAGADGEPQAGGKRG
ncbi:DedA family protein [Micromonospora sp. NBC_00330]|uniref:DedA family protein n=1 Tax=Micromonospora sp. NBC_00330 TaxID=2903585 RepID=UPI002E2877B3|nr:DedA family protein [Micromonospora sp. NBC_00330]